MDPNLAISGEAELRAKLAFPSRSLGTSNLFQGTPKTMKIFVIDSFSSPSLEGGGREGGVASRSDHDATPSPALPLEGEELNRSVLMEYRF